MYKFYLSELYDFIFASEYALASSYILLSLAKSHFVLCKIIGPQA